MIKLKNYQKQTLDEFENFLIQLRKSQISYSTVFIEITKKSYNSHNLDVPFICIKMPTGGGKTLIATHAINSIFDKYVMTTKDNGLVIWLVPTDEIRTQTLSALQNDSHPYRQILNTYFSNNVLVFGSKEAIKGAIKKSDLENNVCILLATFATFRIADKEGRKAYEDNGYLSNHFESDEQTHSLVEMIKKNKPLIIIDEGHNAKSKLSTEMIQSLNPIFVVEFTATPRIESNILVNISAQQLQDENMIKIPIYLQNVTQWQATIREGIAKREYLEKIAKKEKGEYLRPIALLQAEQEKPHEKKIYVDKIRNYLINDLKIPEKEIAIRTGKQNDIKDINLFSKKCPIRYIITVSALKEGWDNSFAYVLISVANLESRISIEQILGRILRLHNQRLKKQHELNCSYVFTPSRTFAESAKALEKGLVMHGYPSNALKKAIKDQPIKPENIYSRIIKDNKINIPCFAVKHKNKFRRLNFHTDLLGENFRLQDQPVDECFSLYFDQNKLQKYDIVKGDKIEKSSQQSLEIQYYDDDFDKTRLLNWLDKKITRNEYTQKDKRIFLEKIVAYALDIQNLSLSELSKNAYTLRDSINLLIDKIEKQKARKSFKDLEKNNKLYLNEIFFEMKNTIQINNICIESFNRHLFERAGKLNGEELDLILKIDGLENVKWWYRNTESVDFFLQGWQKNRFFPDFIIKTHKNRYVIVEYKGENLVTNDDTKYKVELGIKYEKLCNNNFSFELVKKNTIVNFINKLKEM